MEGANNALSFHYVVESEGSFESALHTAPSSLIIPCVAIGDHTMCYVEHQHGDVIPSLLHYLTSANRTGRIQGCTVPC